MTHFSVADYLSINPLTAGAEVLITTDKNAHYAKESAGNITYIVIKYILLAQAHKLLKKSHFIKIFVFVGQYFELGTERKRHLSKDEGAKPFSAV